MLDDWADHILGAVSGSLRFIPDNWTRRALSHLRPNMPFFDVGTNHHLKRVLRLAWVEAAQKVLQEAEREVALNPDAWEHRDFAAFQSIMQQSLGGIISSSCNVRPDFKLPECPIDRFIKTLVVELPRHVGAQGGHAGKQEIDDYLAQDIAQLIHWPPAEIPPVFMRHAKHGVQTGKGELRTFGGLMFDALAVVLQNPRRYPQASEAFKLIQVEANREISERIEKALSGIDKEVDKELAARPSDWFSAKLAQQINAIETGIGNLIDGQQNIERTLAQVHKQTSELGQLADNHRRIFANMVERRFDDSAPRRRNTILIAASDDRQTWCNPIGARLEEIAQRIDELAEFDYRGWELDTMLALAERNEHILKRDLWDRLDDNHRATILVVGNDLGEPIPIDRAFGVRLARHGLLQTDAPRPEPNWPTDPAECHRLAEAGYFPLTMATRLALETLLFDRRLMFCLTGEPAEMTAETKAFVDFCEALGAGSVTEEQSRNSAVWLSELLAMVTGHELKEANNPYRRLDFYTLEDAHLVAGRHDELDEARRLLDAALTKDEPAILGVAGSSGSGKSTFLRTRLQPVFADRDQATIIVRPTDFHDGSSSVARTVSSLVERIVREARLTLPSGASKVIKIAKPDKVASLAADYLIRALTSKLDHRPVLCLDQFEEIVDDLADHTNLLQWRSLIEFVDQLARSNRLIVVFTLESSRLGRFERELAASVLARARWIELTDTDRKFYREVVTRPFADAGITLSDDVSDMLVEEVMRLQRSDAISGSPLPLLSLKLHNLFGHVHALGFGARTGKSGWSSRNRRVDTAALGDFPLSIESEVKSLAERAWSEGGGQDEDLGHFLRPLVRVSPDRVEHGRTNMVLGSSRRRHHRTERLIEQRFLAHRLLVPTPGGLRLVHESVVRRWPRAAKWFEQVERELREEAMLRIRAEAWHREGRPPLAGVSPQDVGTAAEMLGAQIRNWSTDEDDAVHDDDRVPYDYCRALFEFAEDPYAPVASSTAGSCYIHLAASNGMVELLNKFLNTHPEAINALSSKNQRSPLSAASYTQLKAVRFLLERGGDPMLADENGIRPIDCAIYSNRRDIFDLLLPLTSSDSGSGKVNNPLYTVAATNGMQFVADLEKHGFRHDVPGRHGWLPLHGSAILGDPETFEYFLGKGDVLASTDDGWLPIHYAAGQGNVEVIAMLLQHDQADVMCEARSNLGHTPLMIAAANHKYKTVEVLVHFCDPNARFEIEGPNHHWTALHWALDIFDRSRKFADRHLKNVTIGTVRALLASSEIDVMSSAGGKSPYAMAEGLSEAQKLLREHRSFDALRGMAGGWTGLMHAIKDRDSNYVDTILRDLGATDDLDYISRDGNSAAKLMLEHGMADRLLLLIQDGRVDCWPNRAGYAGLLPAAYANDATTVVNAIWQRLPTRLRDHQFHGAAQFLLGGGRVHDPESIWFGRLLDRVPDAASLGKLLFTAAMFGRERSFNAMVERGADPQTRDDWDRIPSELAPDGLIGRLPEKIEPARLDAELVRCSSKGDVQGFVERVAQLDSETLAIQDEWSRWPENFAPEGLVDTFGQIRRQGSAAAQRLIDTTKSDKKLFATARTGDMAAFERRLSELDLAVIARADAWGRMPEDVAPDSMTESIAARRRRALS